MEIIKIKLKSEKYIFYAIILSVIKRIALI